LRRKAALLGPAPSTWQARKNGCRRDEARRLVDMFRRDARVGTEAEGFLSCNRIVA
jgi:hypothetical protein